MNCEFVNQPIYSNTYSGSKSKKTNCWDGNKLNITYGITLKESNKLVDNGNNMYHEYSIPNGVKVVHGTVKMYFIDVAKNSDYVNINNKVIGGVPAIAGRRISVTLILACLRDGMSIGDICEDYDLTPDQIIGAIEYAINVLNKPYEEE